MSIHDFLFDDLLIEVFLRLPLKDQLTCKCVCERWFTLLMTDYHFRHLRQLNLVSKLFTLEQISVILTSKYRFTHLVMDEISYKTVPLAQMRPIWDFLGETVTDLVVKGLTDLEIYRVLESFPLLKSLDMYGFYFTWLAEDVIPVLPHVEHLKVSNFFLVNNVDGLFEKLPSLKTIDYDIYNTDDPPGDEMVNCFEKYPMFLKTLRWYDNNKNFDKIREKFLAMPDHNIERFYYYTSDDFRYLGRVLGTFPKISDVNVTCNVIPSCEFFRITALDVKVKNLANFSLKPLAALTNLAEFHFKASNIPCPMGHEAILHEKLKIFHLNLGKCECSECFVTLTKSFPALEIFHLVLKEKTIPKIRLTSLLQHWPKLYKTVFNNRHASTVIEPFVGLTFPSSPHETLKFISITDDIEPYNNIHEFAPNLLSLHFHINSRSAPLDTITGEILPKLPHLKYVLMSFDESSTYQMTEEQNRAAFEDVIQYSTKVEDLQLPILHGNFVMLDEARNFFDNLPHLMHIWFDQLREGRIFVHRVYSRLDYRNGFARHR
ncbi:uncharacterized protein LOC134829446 [Culicoides brevitarsis]|uniref:uncharacterized protein LOC134829446 n=1 Tax=Culicoides brevitarsis TaxID=469753 RepID=UPI00307C9073